MLAAGLMQSATLHATLVQSPALPDTWLCSMGCCLMASAHRHLAGEGMRLLAPSAATNPPTHSHALPCLIYLQFLVMAKGSGDVVRALGEKQRSTACKGAFLACFEHTHAISAAVGPATQVPLLLLLCGAEKMGVLEPQERPKVRSSLL